MYIPVTPLPSIKFLLNLSKHLEIKFSGWIWQCQYHKNIHFFPRGSHALAAVAKAVAGKRERPVCFLPGYFCNQSLDPLRGVGAELVFYRTRANFCPEWEDVYHLAQKKKPDLFVLVHYFGLINDVAGAISFTKDMDCVLLEDCAHILAPYESVAQTNSIQLYCPHKLLSLPPIALLVFSERFFPITFNQYKIGLRKEDIVWGMKRLTQMLIVTMSWDALWKTKTHLSKLSQHEENNRITKNSIASFRTSLFALVGLQAFQNELENICKKRLSNYAYLATIIGQISEKENFLPWPAWPGGMVPYLFPLHISNRHIDFFLNALYKESIPAQKWPDLPPEVLEKPSIYREEIELRNNLLFLPIHQTLTKKHLDYIGNVLQVVLKGGC
jgi:dTDP-4-amino-4,6-dideoxygalactose transaminase